MGSFKSVWRRDTRKVAIHKASFSHTGLLSLYKEKACYGMFVQ